MKKVQFEEFELGPVLGTGTVGTVYRATLKSTGESVAVKILQNAISENELIRARFRREMGILGRMAHPHIIAYLGGGEHEGQLFYVMEVLDGGNAADLLERYGAMSWQEVCSIGRQVCSALQHAHNHGIIHRDLKPSNLFFDTQANVKLGDFGIARDTNSADITTQGLTVGTHSYMSPEQITGEEGINGKADLYSLGCVLFELLTGQKPFQGLNFAQLFEQHLHKKPPRVTELRPEVPEQLAAVIDELLAKDPEQRPFNARAVQAVMQQLLARPEVADNAIPSPSNSSNQAQVAGKAMPASVGNAELTSPLAHADSTTRDVGAAAVVDPGMRSLVLKLQPVPRPNANWKVFAVLSALIALLLWLASLTSR